MNVKNYKDFEVRESKADDFKKIQALYELSFNRELSYEYWNWKNYQNPMGKSIAFLMFDGNTLIGHYYVDASILNYQGQEIKCILSSDTMTHPNYRGLGIFPYLANLTYNKAMEENAILVYGYPNINSHNIFKNKLNWIEFDKLPYVYKDLGNKKRKFQSNEYTISKIEKFNDEIELFFEQIKRTPLIFRKISKPILNWRYCKHPIKQYDKFLIRVKSTNELISYFVSKTFIKSSNEIIIDLVDYYIKSRNFKEEYQIFKKIQDFLINYYPNNCTKFMMWMPNEQILKNAMEELNFKYMEIEAYFGYLFFKKGSYLKQFQNLNNWHLTMGHSDIF